MGPLDNITISLFLAFFLPGFISLKVYELIVPGERTDFSKSFLDAFSFGAINLAITYWLIYYIHSGNFSVYHPFWYYVFSVLILFVIPIFLPIVYLWVTRIPFVARRIIHPIPKSWDYVFGKKESYWVIVHLKDGRRIGGRF
ncbi:MAG: DUF6338 family protein, partial [Bacteroidota bacterium]